jgi:hypothetical protein
VRTCRSLVLGLPESGKTTFIAALWHVVESDEVPSALRLKELTGDRASLNKLRSAWLRCEPVGRTSQQGESLVRMVLADRATGSVTELLLPDMSGETFRDHHWVNRQWAKSFDELVQGAEGVLVFVHPNEVVEPLRIDSVNELAETLPTGSTSPEVAVESVLWDAKTSPSQVQLVDLLQFVLRRRPPALLRVGLIVSAWDLVRGQGLTPQQWCATRLPLLGQFLESNPGRLSTEYYGISAQGGVLPRDADRLRDFTHPSARIEVVVGAEQAVSNDITLPVHRFARGAG